LNYLSTTSKAVSGMTNSTTITMPTVNLIHPQGIIIIEDMIIAVIMVCKITLNLANFADEDYDPADDFVNEYEEDEEGDDDEHLGQYDNIYLNIGKMVF